MDSLLKAYLAERDVPCPGCGYNLRGLTEQRCPECERGIELNVLCEEPSLAWFHRVVIMLAMGVGYFVIAIAWTAHFWITLPVSLPALGMAERLSIYALQMSLFAVPLAIALLRRRRFVSLSLATQRVLATCSAALFLAITAWHVLSN